MGLVVGDTATRNGKALQIEAPLERSAVKLLLPADQMRALPEGLCVRLVARDILGGRTDLAADVGETGVGEPLATLKKLPSGYLELTPNPKFPVEILVSDRFQPLGNYPHELGDEAVVRVGGFTKRIPESAAREQGRRAEPQVVGSSVTTLFEDGSGQVFGYRSENTLQILFSTYPENYSILDMAARCWRPARKEQLVDFRMGTIIRDPAFREYSFVPDDMAADAAGGQALAGSLPPVERRWRPPVQKKRSWW